jgi:hypothetical protein
MLAVPPFVRDPDLPRSLRREALAYCGLAVAWLVWASRKVARLVQRIIWQKAVNAKGGPEQGCCPVARAWLRFEDDAHVRKMGSFDKKVGGLSVGL